MNNPGQTENQETGSELDKLKTQAKEMGIKHHPAMGEVKLRALIDAALAGDAKAEDKVPPVQTLTVSEITELQQLRLMKKDLDAAAIAKPVETDGQARARKKREAEALIRIRVNCMNPNKRDWEGEMYTVSNAVVGTLKKYVPFNNDEGWHVPRMILNHMQEKECQIFYNKKDDRGNKTRHGKLIKELAIEIYDPLTAKELHELAQRQAMRDGDSSA